MKLAVILPVYNSEKYLVECLNSLFKQTFQDFCILAVNDCSTDNSGDILETFAQQDSRLRVYHLPENRGENGVCHFAMNLTKYMRIDYVARMDSDDICMPERFAKQIDFLDNHPEIAVVGTNVEIFSRQSNSELTHLPLNDDIIKAYLVSATDNIANPTSMWRHSWFLEHQIEFGNTRVAGDYAMWVQCALKGAKFANLPESLLRYRLHESQLSKKHEQIIPVVIQALKPYLATLFPQLNPQEIQALTTICYRKSDNVFSKQEILGYYALFDKIADDKQSILGENKAYMIKIIEKRLERFYPYLAKPPKPNKRFTIQVSTH